MSLAVYAPKMIVRIPGKTDTTSTTKKVFIYEIAMNFISSI